ncbi:MAG: TonB-dependent receptor [Betaproteobacteria bacterium]|nr:TonB-dependent receptor [Betaproteobacteria bacterium]
MFVYPGSLCRRAVLPFAIALSAMPAHALGQEAQGAGADLGNFSLEELGNLQVTSVSRKEQRFNDTAAALFVITNEDIRRSGATSLPDVLRMVPGLQVGRIGNDRWAVSARGFAGRFANKLLVQVDGRSVYSPLFSGVFWEVQDMVLDDIERIEVIRGPGAALWGANAVNGIINIITKRSEDTQGVLAQVGAGTLETGFATLRYGGQVDADTQYRVYARGYDRGDTVDVRGTRVDNESVSRHAGFRLDRRLDSDNRFTFSGDLHEVNSRDPIIQPSLTPPYWTTLVDSASNRGGHLLTRYDRTLGDGSQATLRAYVEGSEIESITGTERRDTFDIDFQHRVLLSSRHDLVWGLNYRYSRDEITVPASAAVKFTPRNGHYRIASAFVHDEITLVPERLRLIAGAKLEHNSYTGMEPQPNLRLLWTPTSTSTVWGAWSRAVRTPARNSYGTSVDVNVLPPNSAVNPTPLPALLRYSNVGSALVSEKIEALEIGYRAQLGARLAMDLTAFANRYSDLATGGTDQSVPQVAMDPAPHLLVLIPGDNNLSARTKGVEASLDWRPLDRWRLQASYALLHSEFSLASMDPIRISDAQGQKGRAPENQFSLRSQFDLSPKHQFDLWLRHVSRVSYGDIPAYTTLDARYGWRPSKNFDLSLVGQNLLDERHPEFAMDFNLGQLIEVPRGVFLRATWKM